jgi:hypothetical protein
LKQSKKVTFSGTKKNILSEKKTILSEKKNLGLTEQVQSKFTKENIPAFCEICLDYILRGEIIAYCLCEKFFHPNCLIYYLNKQNQNINKPCNDCRNPYKFASYEESNNSYEGKQNPNVSVTNLSNTLAQTNYHNISTVTVDTNINNLENYEEMNGIAFQLSQEGLVEMISKMTESSVGNEEISRIALSPITFNTTPYSGKTKKQISSNQKVEDYIRLQSKNYLLN